MLLGMLTMSHTADGAPLSFHCLKESFGKVFSIDGSRGGSNTAECLKSLM